MELVLNLVWVLLAAILVKLWLRGGPCKRRSTRTQLAALAMIIVTFFPVISVTDDLQTIQNPAEVDYCARRIHAASCPHFILPAVATLPPPVFARSSFGFSHFAVPSHLPTPFVEIPALASIQNRPPPTV
jgi:hypothetical protein